MNNYKKISNDARKKVLKMIHKAGTSHIGSNFSCIDILAVLFSNLKLDKNLKEDRDRFILSKGWAAAALYFFLAKRGIIPKRDLETYCLGNSKYIGLSEPTVRGVEAAGGAMGHGLPIALGISLASKLGEEKWRTYVLTQILICWLLGHQCCLNRCHRHPLFYIHLISQKSLVWHYHRDSLYKRNYRIQFFWLNLLL